MKSKTVFVILGVSAAGAAAWWYMKNKGAAATPTQPPTVVDKIMATNPGVILAPMTSNYPIKDNSPSTLPSTLLESNAFKMSSNTGIVPPTLAPSSTKTVQSIPTIAPPPPAPMLPKETATSSPVALKPATKTSSFTTSILALKKSASLRGLQGLSMPYQYQ
jgi:hypothetical protein